MMRSVSVVIATAIVGFALDAAAQGGHPRPPTLPAGSTTKTADYLEQRVDGDQIVRFTGDELVGPTGGAYGDVIRRPPGIIRVQLIRPRMNFLPELFKSVENL